MFLVFNGMAEDRGSSLKTWLPLLPLLKLLMLLSDFVPVPAPSTVEFRYNDILRHPTNYPYIEIILISKLSFKSRKTQK